jgi:chromosomal replication initiator protein
MLETPDLMRKSPNGLSLAPQIIRVVANHYGLQVEDLTGVEKWAHFVRARHIAMFFMRDLLGYSLVKIARCLKRADHTTVLGGLRRLETAMQKDPALAAEVARIRAKLER